MNSGMHQQHPVSKNFISYASLWLWCTQGHDNFVWGGGGQEIKGFLFCHEGVVVIMLINMRQKLCVETLMSINWQC